MSDPPDSSTPIRTDYLLDEIRDVRAEVRSVRSDVHGEIREQRAEIGSLRTEVASLNVEVGSLRTEVGSLREDLRSGLNRVTAITGVLFTALAVLVTIVQFAIR